MKKVYQPRMEIIRDNAVSKAWRVYGIPGHRQRESFSPSCFYEYAETYKNFVSAAGTNPYAGLIELYFFNSDITGTNDYAIILVIAESAEICEKELDGQISDGAFENARVGAVEELTEEEVGKLKSYADTVRANT